MCFISGKAYIGVIFVFWLDCNDKGAIEMSYYFVVLFYHGKNSA